MGKPGYVYVMRLDSSTNTLECPHKIGKSKTPDIRQRQIGVQLPHPLSLIHVIKADDMDALERQLHERFDACRLNGEWFRFSDRELDELMTIAGGGPGMCGGCVCWDYNPRCIWFDSCHSPKRI